jgi:hypothetical protein
MNGRYRRAGEVAGQLAIAAVVLAGIIICAALVAALMFAAMVVGS